jgi:hypothetical protein
MDQKTHQSMQLTWDSTNSPTMVRAHLLVTLPKTVAKGGYTGSAKMVVQLNHFWCTDVPLARGSSALDIWTPNVGSRCQPHVCRL